MTTILQVGIIRVGNDPVTRHTPIPSDYFVLGPVTVLVTGSATTVPGLAAPANLRELDQLAWYVKTVGNEAVQVAFNGAAASDTNGFLMDGSDCMQHRCTTVGATVSVKTRAVA